MTDAQTRAESLVRSEGVMLHIGPRGPARGRTRVAFEVVGGLAGIVADLVRRAVAEEIREAVEAATRDARAQAIEAAARALLEHEGTEAPSLEHETVAHWAWIKEYTTRREALRAALDDGGSHG
jgi:hypothetical protein